MNNFSLKKVFVLSILFCLITTFSFAQKPDFLKETIEEHAGEKAMPRIKKRINTEFNMFGWARTLKDHCASTISNKSTNNIPYIAQQRFVVRALLKLSTYSTDAEFKKVLPELNSMKALYDQIKIEKGAESSDDGGFSGLFDDEKTEDVNITFKQLKTLRKIAGALQKKLQ